jgi:hypothetical protein
MERPIAYDKLAREDRFVRMRARRVGEIRAEQGLPRMPDLSSVGDPERIQDPRRRAPGDGGRPTVYDFPALKVLMDGRARPGTSATSGVQPLAGHLGSYIGEFPRRQFWRCACAETPQRVAGVNRSSRAACDVFVNW